MGLLNVLFNSNPIGVGNTNSSNGGTIDSQDLYLLTWSSQPTLPVQVSGQRLPQGGITLSFGCAHDGIERDPI